MDLSSIIKVGLGVGHRSERVIRFNCQAEYKLPKSYFSFMDNITKKNKTSFRNKKKAKSLMTLSHPKA